MSRSIGVIKRCWSISLRILHILATLDHAWFVISPQSSDLLSGSYVFRELEFLLCLKFVQLNAVVDVFHMKLFPSIRDILRSL
jgi:hypothetical protein